MGSGNSIVSCLGIQEYLRETYFRNGTDPMRRNKRSSLCQRSFVVRLFERLHLPDGESVTSKAEIGCVSVRV